MSALIHVMLILLAQSSFADCYVAALKGSVKNIYIHKNDKVTNLVFSDNSRVARSPVLLTRANGKPFASLEIESSGFFYDSFTGGKMIHIVTSGPPTFLNSDAGLEPYFAKGKAQKIWLKRTHESVCAKFFVP